MQQDLSSHSRKFVERFKDKCWEFASGVVLAAAEEEMRIGREEFTRRIDRDDSPNLRRTRDARDL